MQAYFDGPAVEPLSATEIERLQAQLDPTLVRYAPFDLVNQQIVERQILATPAEALLNWGAEAHVATVLLPPASRT